MDMSVSLPSDKLLKIQQLAHSLLQTQPVNSPSDHVLFGKDHLLSKWTCTALLVVSFHLE